MKKQENPMNRLLRTIAPILALLGLIALAGCAHKAAPAPQPPTSSNPTPVPTPTPPTTTTTAPAPTPSTETATLHSEDLQPVFFDFDSATLNDQARSTLDQDAKTLRDHSAPKLVIEGHCDERGTAEYNQALGERRAQAARDYLIAAGVAAGRIEVISYGKERPFDSGHDESAWAKNRRAHFTIGS